MTDLRALWAALGLAILPGATLGDAAEDAQNYLLRIEELDDSGPQLNAVIAFNSDAPDLARRAEDAGLPLSGRTVLVKDNIETREWPTTAGSLALAGNDTGRDAPLIVRLRESGGVVLGKANLSEWANIRSRNSTSGWSAVGGLTRNPHAIDRSACGSSSGSAAAVAAGMVWAAIGTETNGSITCPASVNGIVGFKPTVGLVSRTHIVPISPSQDTAGPMARSVYDAALLLNAISGTDPADPATAAADLHKVDFTAGLDRFSLNGVRIGVMRGQQGTDPRIVALFERALSDLEAVGAVPIDIAYGFPDGLGRDELSVLLFELRESLGAYLGSSPADNSVENLSDVIAFNAEHAEAELRWFGQDLFEAAVRAVDREAYDAARASILRSARDDGLDRLLTENDVSFLVAPTARMAWSIDLLEGDGSGDSIGAGTLPAIAGYPHLTVPMGAVEGLPVGLSIIGGQWSDHAVLRAGASYESVRSSDIPEPSLARWTPDD